MKEHTGYQSNNELRHSPEKIDGRLWLRQIFKERKPRLLYKLEDCSKLETVREAISNMEIASFLSEVEVFTDEMMIVNIREQKAEDLMRACPNESKKYLLGKETPCGRLSKNLSTRDTQELSESKEDLSLP